MNVKNVTNGLKTIELGGAAVLTTSDLERILGGTGPLGEALEWYYMTMGSFYRGLWDGLTGQEAKA